MEYSGHVPQTVCQQNSIVQILLIVLFVLAVLGSLSYYIYNKYTTTTKQNRENLYLNRMTLIEPRICRCQNCPYKQ